MIWCLASVKFRRLLKPERTSVNGAWRRLLDSVASLHVKRRPGDGVNALIARPGQSGKRGASVNYL